MTRDSNVEWQRTTALRKIERDREDARQKGEPVVECVVRVREETALPVLMGSPEAE